MKIESEIGKIKRVIVHCAMLALAMVDPADSKELLLEDTLDPQRVGWEHGLFVRCLRKVAGRGVLDLQKLLIETANTDEGKAHLAKLLPGRRLPKSLSPKELVVCLLTGYLGTKRLALPIPNLMFTRDLGAAVGKYLFLANSGQPARAREPALLNAVFQFHPDHKHPTIRAQYALEGGDVLVLRRDIVMVGESERTKGAAIVARLNDFRAAGVEHVLSVVMPSARWNMHLDTVFNQIDKGDYLAFRPLFNPRRGEKGAHVVAYDLRKGDNKTQIRTFKNLPRALEAHGIPVDKFISCGDGVNSSLSEWQEQWTDGYNAFTLRPGLPIVYRQNRRINKALYRSGYELVDAEKFADPRFIVPVHRKMAVVLSGYEIGHGRGGPHCLTLPIEREEVE